MSWTECLNICLVNLAKSAKILPRKYIEAILVAARVTVDQPDCNDAAKQHCWHVIVRLGGQQEILVCETSYTPAMGRQQLKAKRLAKRSSFWETVDEVRAAVAR